MPHTTPTQPDTFTQRTTALAADVPAPALTPAEQSVVEAFGIRA